MRRTITLGTSALLVMGAVLGGAGAADAMTALEPTGPTSVDFSRAALPMKAVPKGRADAAKLLASLSVRSESHAASYERSRFDVWNDADRDGEDTRAEVLKKESRTTASVNSYGTVKGGRWVSAYDNKVVTKAARLDVDHMVPLAEAWASGAWKWSDRKREAFGNDLGFGPSLVAVTLQSNRSKGDRDPAGWLPPSTSAVCAYVKHFIAVKARWGLSVDRAEKAAMSDGLATCTTFAVAKAGAPVIGALTQPVTRTTSQPSGGTTTGTGGGTATSSAYYKNCDAARAAGAAPVRAGDPGYGRHLDRDGDGVGCE